MAVWQTGQPALKTSTLRLVFMVFLQKNSCRKTDCVN
jgi:hypothetical protein